MKSRLEPSPETLRRVQARRFGTGGAAAKPVDELVDVAVEAPLTIDVDGVDSYTLLCTPGDERALTYGFLLSEGVIEYLDDVAALKPCRDNPGIMRVRLKDQLLHKEEQAHHRLIVSSCGLCGNETVDQRIDSFPKVGDSLHVDGELLRSVSIALRAKQTAFQACGGTHAAGIFDGDGKLLAWAEDTGRHNALDKAIGRCMLDGVDTAGRAAVLSGRVSLEMVGKCAWPGLELISAISAPTSLALEVAQRCNITLCAFVREDRATVFTHPRRVIDPTS